MNMYGSADPPIVAMMEFGIVGSGFGKGSSNFHRRQPHSPIPASHGQLAYRDCPCEFLGPLNTFTKAPTFLTSPRQSVPGVSPGLQPVPEMDRMCFGRLLSSRPDRKSTRLNS